jgi:hypothetical protein
MAAGGGHNGFRRITGDLEGSGPGLALSLGRTSAKITVRKLRTGIDDVCDTGKISDKLASEGIDPDSVTIPGCVIFNPGLTNTFSIDYTFSRSYGNTEGQTKSDIGQTDISNGLSVFNVTDERKPLNSFATYEASPQTVLNNYDVGQYYQTPRYARLTATYDF